MVGVARWQHDRTGVGYQVRLDRERHWAVRAHRIPRPRLHLGSPGDHSSVRHSRTAGWIGGMTVPPRSARPRWNAQYACLPEAAAVAVKRDSLIWQQAVAMHFGANTALYF